ncbi:hypothetical protein ACFS07_26000 [Undibacterium arcticum]
MAASSNRRISSGDKTRVKTLYPEPDDALLLAARRNPAPQQSCQSPADGDTQQNGADLPHHIGVPHVAPQIGQQVGKQGWYHRGGFRLRSKDENLLDS